MPDDTWSSQSSAETFTLCKISHSKSIREGESIPVVTRSLTVKSDRSWMVIIHEKRVAGSHCHALKGFPAQINCADALQRLVQAVSSLYVCAGHPEEEFVSLVEARKGKIQRGTCNEESAVIDEYPVELNGQVYFKTVCSANCEILVHEVKCDACKAYRPNLRSLRSRHKKQINLTPTKRTSAVSRVNFRYLNTPEKVARLSSCSTEAKVAKKEIKRLKERLKELGEKEGICVDNDLHSDLTEIIGDQTNEVRKAFSPGTFARLFWEQQIEALKCTDSRQVRWHPMIIKWCLSIKLRSSSSYNALSNSGVLVLPFDRTLRDYTHFVKAQAGFSPEVDKQLQREAKLDSIPLYQRNVCLVFDEVKIKEDLVYDKHSGDIIGFVNLGETNDLLLAFEQAHLNPSPQPQLATHMLVFMVCGILSNLEFPYAQFPCTTVTGDQLYSLVWGCVRQLETAGFKVLATTCDGASSNRKFIGLHGKDGEFIYKTVNPFSDEPRPLFFFSDAPHLIKTVRNCWANSFAHTNSRTLWVSNVHVLLPLTSAATIIICMIMNTFNYCCTYCY